jgi:hypothetical protein
MFESSQPDVLPSELHHPSEGPDSIWQEGMGSAYIVPNAEGEDSLTLTDEHGRG